MIYHNIEPVFNAESKILILGSFPSPKSRESGFFYGNPKNRLWKVLSCVCGSSIPKTNGEKKEFLLKNKIAMWDVVISCEIIGASDNSIKNVCYSDLDRVFSHANIKAVFTLGNTATNLYKKAFNNVCITHIALPSTSPANATFSCDNLIEKFTIIKQYLS